MPIPEEKVLSLDTLGGGALHELLDQQLPLVRENILDPNTEAKEKRTIVMTLTFLPTNTERTEVSVACKAQTKLAPTREHVSTAYLTRRKGQERFVTIDTSQMAIDEIPDGVAQMPDRHEENGA